MYFESPYFTRNMDCHHLVHHLLIIVMPRDPLLHAHFNTPLASHMRFEDIAGAVTLHDTGHGVFQLVEHIRRVGGEIRVLVGKGFQCSQEIERFMAETAVP